MILPSNKLMPYISKYRIYSPSTIETHSSILGVYPGVYPGILQENSLNRETWRATIHGVAKSMTWLSK